MMLNNVYGTIRLRSLKIYSLGDVIYIFTKNLEDYFIGDAYSHDAQLIKSILLVLTIVLYGHNLVSQISLGRWCCFVSLVASLNLLHN